MINRLKNLFAPPFFTNEDQLIAARLLHSVLILVFFGLIGTSILALLVTESPVQALTVYMVAALIPLGLMFNLRRGRVRQTGVLLVGGLWVVITAVNVLWGGAESPGIHAYIMLSVVAGLALGRRAIAINAAVSVVTIAGLYLLTVNDLLPEPISASSPLVMSVIAINHVIITSLVMGVAISLFVRTMRRMSRNRAQQAEMLKTLQEASISKNYFDSILRSMSNLLLVLELDHTVKMVNPAVLHTLGYTEQEIIGLSFTQVANVTPQKMRHLLTANQQVSDDTQDREFILLAKDGHRVPVAFNLSVLFSDAGDPAGIVVVAQDVSQIKATQVERIRNAMRYRALFEQANDAIFLINMDGRHFAVNKRAVEMFGFSEAELLTRTFRDLITRDSVPESEDIFTRLKEGEFVAPYERIFVRKNGEQFPTEVNIELVRDVEGNPLHVQSIVRDISERKRAAEELEYQGRLLDIINDAVISTDMENNILTWNKAAEKLYGWSAEEVIGRKLTDVVPTNFPDNANKFIKEQYLSRGHWQQELVQYNRKREALHVLSSVSIVRNPGATITGVVTINHDISARKRAEMQLESRVIQLAALRQIDIEVSSSLNISDVTQIALNAAYVLSNASAGALFINDAGDFYVAETIGDYEYVHKSHHVRLDRGVTARALRLLEAQLVLDVSDDPDYYPDLPDTCALMAIPLLSQGSLIGLLLLETNNPTHFTHEVFEYVNILTARIATALDNARLYQLAQQQVAELQALYQRVSNLEELKTEMIKIGSHDLRNPIGIIGGYLAMLQEDIVPDLTTYHQEFFNEMGKAVGRMRHITEEILSLERIEKIASNTATVEIDLRQMVRRVLLETERAAKNKHLSLTAHIPDTPLLINVDPPQIHEAIFNLVENAIKYTREYKAIHVELSRDEENAIVRVIDEGFGVPEDQQEHMFKEGFRAVTDETQEIEGTGWGLYLVRNIIIRHGGEMIFESVHGEGSTFGFVLPFEPKPRGKLKMKNLPDIFQLSSDIETTETPIPQMMKGSAGMDDSSGLLDGKSAK